MANITSCHSEECKSTTKNLDGSYMQAEILRSAQNDSVWRTSHLVILRSIATKNLDGSYMQAEILR